MSGFTIRCFVQRNLAAVAAHCPVPPVARAGRALLAGSTKPATNASQNPLEKAVYTLLGGSVNEKAGFSLMSASEMEWVRQQHSERAEESRIVFFTRPSQSAIKGLGSGALNVVLSGLFSPLVFLITTLERLRTAPGVAGKVLSPVYGLFWGGAFLSTGLYAAVQQAVLGASHSLVSTPLHYLLSRAPRPAQKTGTTSPEGPSITRACRAALWSPLGCRYEGVVGNTHPWLHYAPTDEMLQELGQRRQARARSRNSHTSSSHKAQYKGRGTPEDDYYALLGVSRDASRREIKEAYNSCALRCHPDRSPRPDAAAQFDAITKAYRVLSNPEKRRKYDIGGLSIVEDSGVKKREAIRALFGGDALIRLAGDVMTGAFSRRVIDELDQTAEEIAIFHQRMLERSRDELLTVYLDKYRVPTVSGAAGWDVSMKERLRGFSGTGLGREVLHCIGREYQRCVTYYDTEYDKATIHSDVSREYVSAPPPVVVVRRVQLYFLELGPHRWQQHMQRLRFLTTVRPSVFKDSEKMVDLAWYTNAAELEHTARWAALSLLYDATITDTERRRRRDALAALAATFVQNGRPYRGANKSTMDTLMASLREYQQRQQKQREQG